MFPFNVTPAGQQTQLSIHKTLVGDPNHLYHPGDVFTFRVDFANI